MTASFDDRLAELRQRFLARAAADALTLTELTSELELRGRRATSLTDLRRIAHWLAGAGGTFQFAEISARATELEALVTDLPNSPELTNACLAVILEIRQAINKVGS